MDFYSDFSKSEPYSSTLIKFLPTITWLISLGAYMVWGLFCLGPIWFGVYMVGAYMVWGLYGLGPIWFGAYLVGAYMVWGLYDRTPPK